MIKAIIIFALCIIPSLLILLYVYSKDIVEKEPIKLLVLLFIGGIIASLISTFISVIFKYYIPFLSFDYSKMNTWQLIFKVLVIIALTEELSKWLIYYITVWKNKNNNYFYDSIVYAVFISLGFATYENIIYANAYISQGFIPVLLRGIISVPSHAVFGIFMGYFLASARKESMKKRRNKTHKYLLLSIIIPTSLHFIYDLLLTNKNTYTFMIFSSFIIIIYIISFLLLNKAVKIKKPLIKTKS